MKVGKEEIHCQTGSSSLSWPQSQNGAAALIAVAQLPHSGHTDWLCEVPEGQSLYWLMV